MSVDLNQQQYLYNVKIYQSQSGQKEEVTDVNNIGGNNGGQNVLAELQDIAGNSGWNALYDRLQELKDQKIITGLRTAEDQDGVMKAKFKYNGKLYEIYCPKENGFNEDEIERLKGKGPDAVEARLQELQDSGKIKFTKSYGDGEIIYAVNDLVTGLFARVTYNLPKNATFASPSRTKEFMNSKEFEMIVMYTGVFKTMPKEKDDVISKIIENHYNDFWKVTKEQLRDEFINTIMSDSMNGGKKVNTTTEGPFENTIDTDTTEDSDKHSNLLDLMGEYEQLAARRDEILAAIEQKMSIIAELRDLLTSGNLSEDQRKEILSKIGELEHEIADLENDLRRIEMELAKIDSEIADIQKK